MAKRTGKATKKAAPKKAVKKAAAKKAAKKTAPKKGARKKAAAAKTAKKAARRVTKKAAARRAPVRKAAAKKAPARAPVKKAAAKKASVRKAAPKKAVAKKAVAKKVTAKKAARPRRAARPAPIRGAIPSSLGVVGSSSSAARSGRADLVDRIQGHNETGPAITAGDLDANWEVAYSSGDEAPGGDNPTPDQDIVDEIGHALGIEYADNEELKGAAKLEERDRHRWELDPASAEDYPDHES